MSNFKEAVSHTSDLVKEFKQKYQYGLLDRADSAYYFETTIADFTMQAEHLSNTSAAIADEAQNLLDSLCAKHK